MTTTTRPAFFDLPLQVPFFMQMYRQLSRARDSLMSAHPGLSVDARIQIYLGHRAAVITAVNVKAADHPNHALIESINSKLELSSGEVVPEQAFKQAVTNSHVAGVLDDWLFSFLRDNRGTLLVAPVQAVVGQGY